MQDIRGRQIVSTAYSLRDDMESFLYRSMQHLKYDLNAKCNEIVKKWRKHKRLNDLLGFVQSNQNCSFLKRGSMKKLVTTSSSSRLQESSELVQNSKWLRSSKANEPTNHSQQIANGSLYDIENRERVDEIQDANGSNEKQEEGQRSELEMCPLYRTKKQFCDRQSKMHPQNDCDNKENTYQDSSIVKTKHKSNCVTQRETMEVIDVEASFNSAHHQGVHKENTEDPILELSSGLCAKHIQVHPKKLDQLIDYIVTKTDGWSVNRLVQLRSQLQSTIWQFRSEYVILDASSIQDLIKVIYYYFFKMYC